MVGRAKWWVGLRRAAGEQQSSVRDEADILREAARLLESGEAFVMATVIGCKGSTPRNPGARMLFRGDDLAGGGGLVGTVGGGQFEHLVIDAARSHLKRGTGGIEKYVLGSDADQCCGGVMEVFFEHHGAGARVVIFGAGHVGKEIADLLAAGPVAVTIADDRPDWNSAERFPRAQREMDFAKAVEVARAVPRNTLALVMTCSHDTDLELLRGLLAEELAEEAGAGQAAEGEGGSGGGMPAFVGLIGSASKRACLFGRLVASGIDEERVRRVHCPIGVGDAGKEPKLVAISIAAQVLVEAKKLREGGGGVVGGVVGGAVGGVVASGAVAAQVNGRGA